MEKHNYIPTEREELQARHYVYAMIVAFVLLLSLAVILP